jgi:hypothetical protein
VAGTKTSDNRRAERRKETTMASKPKEHAEAFDPVKVFEGQQLNLDTAPMGAIRDQYQKYVHLLVDVASQLPVAGTQANDRDELLKKYLAHLAKIGVMPKRLDAYMFRYGPMGVMQVENGLKAVQNQFNLAASDTARNA